ncbi:MAG TPA: hypothetical protein VE422_19250 [Terriglobia bacterium]|nr:hypothetical protein [Terriglobia bacterium]
MYRYLTTLAVVALAMCQIAAGRVPPARFIAGDLIAEITLPDSPGPFGGTRGIAKAIGFDGRYLYYAEYAGMILHRINVPPPGASLAAGLVDTPILGAPSGIMAISYDASRDAFWAVGGDGLSIYLLTKAGQATLIYGIDPLNDRPGNCKQGCGPEAKINYDGADDTIWYAPDVSMRIYHYQTSPDALGTAQLVAATPFVDVDVPPNDMYIPCGYSQVSGLAVGGANLYITVAGCPYYLEFTKTGIKAGYYPEQPSAAGDLECDNLSYSVSVIWARDGWNPYIRAYQQPAPNACIFGGGPRAAP